MKPLLQACLRKYLKGALKSLIINQNVADAYFGIPPNITFLSIIFDPWPIKLNPLYYQINNTQSFHYKNEITFILEVINDKGHREASKGQIRNTVPTVGLKTQVTNPRPFFQAHPIKKEASDVWEDVDKCLVFGNWRLHKNMRP